MFARHTHRLRCSRCRGSRRQQRHQPTCSTAFFTFSMVLAVTSACRGSSSPGSIWPSFRPTFPSLTEPFPRIMILAQHSFSMFFRVLPLEAAGRQKSTRRSERVSFSRRDKCGSPWSNQETHKVDLRVFILGDHNFVANSGSRRPKKRRGGGNMCSDTIEHLSYPMIIFF